jgi:hypothetical protein
MEYLQKKRGAMVFCVKSFYRNPPMVGAMAPPLPPTNLCNPPGGRFILTTGHKVSSQKSGKEE